MSEQTTFPRLLQGLATSRPTDVAMQEKLYGIWQPITWQEYADEVRDFAHGLASLGVSRGDIVAVLGDNRPRSSDSRFSMNDISCHIPARCRRTSAAETTRSSISFSRSSREGGSLARSCFSISMSCSSKKATAFLQLVQLGLR